MEFETGLTERIREQIGLELASDESFAFFQASGNEHLVQFFFNVLSDEYWELDAWDRYHLFLCDLSSELNVDFVLDDDARFATFSYRNDKPTRTAELVMDLRDDYIIPIYYFGDSKTCLKINQQLVGSKKLHPCYLGSAILEQMICELDTITNFDVDFEQQSVAFQQPVILKGSFSGSPANILYHQYQQHNRSYLNIDKIAGRLTDETQGTIVFHTTGMIQIDDCRLSEFMEVVKQLFLLLRTKYKSLVHKYVLEWVSSPSFRSFELKGNFIEIWLNQPLDSLDSLLRFLARGDKSNPLFGVTERISRKLWSVKSVTADNSISGIEIEVSSKMLRIYLKDRGSIPILDSIEHYLRRHVAVDYDNFYY